MTKQLAVAGFSFFLMSVASAYPAVGDRVEYQGTATVGTQQNAPYQASLEVVYFDDVTNVWVVRSQEEIAGQTQSSLEPFRNEEIFTPQIYQSVIATCVESGGAVEEITVPAGTFRTCHTVISDSNNVKAELWIGDVPFGIVKVNAEDASAPDRVERRQFELSSVRSAPASPD